MPCRLCIHHVAFTCILRWSLKLNVKRTWTGSAFSHQWECLKCNGHGLAILCVKWLSYHAHIRTDDWATPVGEFAYSHELLYCKYSRQLQYMTSRNGIVSTTKKSLPVVVVNFGERLTLPIKRDSAYCSESTISPSVGMVVVTGLGWCGPLGTLMTLFTPQGRSKIVQKDWVQFINLLKENRGLLWWI